MKLFSSVHGTGVPQYRCSTPQKQHPQIQHPNPAPPHAPTSCTPKFSILDVAPPTSSTRASTGPIMRKKPTNFLLSARLICHPRGAGLQDAIGVWAELYGEEQPPIVLVGHSMGGAVAVRCAATKVNIAIFFITAGHATCIPSFHRPYICRDSWSSRSLPVFLSCLSNQPGLTCKHWSVVLHTNTSTLHLPLQSVYIRLRNYCRQL